MGDQVKPVVVAEEEEEEKLVSTGFFSAGFGLSPQSTIKKNPTPTASDAQRKQSDSGSDIDIPDEIPDQVNTFTLLTCAQRVFFSMH
jgi:hypothetical protein